MWMEGGFTQKSGMLTVAPTRPGWRVKRLVAGYEVRAWGMGDAWR